MCAGVDIFMAIKCPRPGPAGAPAPGCGYMNPASLPWLGDLRCGELCHVFAVQSRALNPSPFALGRRDVRIGRSAKYQPIEYLHKELATQHEENKFLLSLLPCTTLIMFSRLFK